jgi:hypothetical protein
MTKDEAIQHLLDEFDFYKVHKAMEVLDWAWFEANFNKYFNQSNE